MNKTKNVNTLMDKRNGNLKQVTLRLDAELWKRLKILAVENGMFINSMITKDLEKLITYRAKRRKLH